MKVILLFKIRELYTSTNLIFFLYFLLSEINVSLLVYLREKCHWLKNYCFFYWCKWMIILS